MLRLTVLLFASCSLVLCQVTENYNNQAGQGVTVPNDPRNPTGDGTFGTGPYGTGRDGFRNPSSSPQYSPQYDPFGRNNQFYNQLPPYVGLENSGYQPGLYNLNPGFYQPLGSYNSNYPFQDFGLNDPIFRQYDIQRNPYNDLQRNYQFNDRGIFNLPTDPAYRPNRPISNPFFNPIDSINQPSLDPSRRPSLDPFQRPPLSSGQRPNTYFDLDPNRPINQPRFGPLDPALRPNPNFDPNPTHPNNYPNVGPTVRPLQDPAPGSVPDYGQKVLPGTFNRPNLYSGQKPVTDNFYRPVGGPFSPNYPQSRRFPDPTQRNGFGPGPKAFPPPLNNRPAFVPPRPQSHFSPEYYSQPGYQPSGIESLGRAGPQYSSSSPAPPSRSNISPEKLGPK